MDGRIEAVGGHFTGIDATIKALDERVSGALAPLADELRLRPGHAEVEEIVAKVVGAAQAEMTTRLDSLEETVLTLAEALLRPARHRRISAATRADHPAAPRVIGRRAAPREEQLPAHTGVFPGQQPGSRAGRPSVAGRGGRAGYSHSMVPGGLLVTSSTTRFTCGTSLVMRVEMCARTSSGSRAQSAVIASSLVTGRSTTGWP